MNPIAYRIGSAWMLVTSIVAGVDTYQGMNCADRVGGYIQPFNGGTADDRRMANALIALPYGIVRGVLYNAGQSLGTEGACGANSYTVRFANGFSNLFNGQAAGFARGFFLLNQGFLGAPGALFGGIVAEELHVFGAPPAKVARLTP